MRLSSLVAGLCFLAGLASPLAASVVFASAAALPADLVASAEASGVVPAFLFLSDAGSQRLQQQQQRQQCPATQCSRRTQSAWRWAWWPSGCTGSESARYLLAKIAQNGTRVRGSMFGFLSYGQFPKSKKDTKRIWGLAKKNCPTGTKFPENEKLKQFRTFRETLQSPTPQDPGVPGVS